MNVEISDELLYEIGAREIANYEDLLGDELTYEQLFFLFKVFEEAYFIRSDLCH